MLGHGGVDKLYGYGGNDTMDGGAGADLMTGYAGNDTFIANDGFADSIFGGRDNDKADLDDLLDEVESVEALT